MRTPSAWTGLRDFLCWLGLHYPRRWTDSASILHPEVEELTCGRECCRYRIDYRVRRQRQAPDRPLIRVSDHFPIVESARRLF